MDAILEDYPWECYETLPNATKRKLEATLLLEIVEKSNSALDARYLIRKNCEELLQENASFRRKLLRCWLIGSFEDLLTAEELQPLASDPPVEQDLMSTDMQLSIQNTSIYGGRITQVHGNLITHNYSLQSAKERQDLMNWLSEIDYARIHNDIASKRVPDTGEWFIESSEVQTWIDQPSTQILWCPGIPGVGKTVLSSLVVDHLEKERRMPTCVIYLNYKRYSIQTPSHIFASMLRQLYSYESLPCEPVDKLWDAHSSLKSEPSEDELYLALLDTLNGLESMTYLVLDALDEYTKHYSDALIGSLLSKLATAKSTKLKIMVTSRVLGGMEQLFIQAGALRREVFSADNDIALYVQHRATNELSFMTNSQIEELRQRILHLTRERFLVAQLHMNSLSGLLNWGEIKDALDRLSDDIDKAYEGVMYRINEQDQRRRELANKVLLWVACTKQNLSIKDIQFALAIAPGRKKVRDYLYSLDIITSVCAGLVIVDQENGIVRFMHQTAQEFFESTRDVYFNSPDRVICDNSLTYLSSCIPRNLTSLKQLKPGPLLRFISQHWLSHLRQCQAEMFPTTTAFGLQRSKILHAIQLSSVIGDRGDSPEHDAKRCEALWNIRVAEEAVLDNSIPSIHIASALDLSHVLRLILADGVGPNIPLPTSGLSPLSLSVVTASERAITVLLGDARTDPSATDNDGNCPLALASIAGSYQLVKLLLDQNNVDVNSANRRSQTSLTHAAQHGHILIVRLLLERTDIDVNAQDHNGQTALMIALERGGRSKDVALSLLRDPRLDLGRRDILGHTISHIVASHDSSLPRIEPEILVTFYELYRNLFFEHTGIPFLVFLAQRNYIEAFKMILNQFPDSVDLNVGSGESGTPLLHAAMHRWVDLVRVLLANPNISINARDRNGQTPLMKAAERSYLPSIHCLLNVQVQVNAVDKNGRTALMLAILANATPITIDCLLDAGANVQVEDEEHQTALSFACRQGLDTVVDKLIKRGADVNSRDIELRTPLIQAMYSEGFFSVIKLLIKHGADVNARDEQLRTPLIHAVISNPTIVILPIMLLEVGADPNAAGIEGRTALSYAAEFDCYSSVEALLKNGANPDIYDSIGWSPLAYSLAQISRILSRKIAQTNVEAFQTTVDSGDPAFATFIVLLQYSQQATPEGVRNLGRLLTRRADDHHSIILDWISERLRFDWVVGPPQSSIGDSPGVPDEVTPATPNTPPDTPPNSPTEFSAAYLADLSPIYELDGLDDYFTDDLLRRDG